MPEYWNESFVIELRKVKLFGCALGIHTIIKIDDFRSNTASIMI